MSEGVHPKNRLNSLPNREWLKETKSFWRTALEGSGGELSAALVQFVAWVRTTREPEEVEALLGQLDDSFVYSRTPPRSELKALHPATFSELDVERLIRLFTREGERVLDPFVGSGSTLIACARAGRAGVGIEVSERWAQVSRDRVREEAGTGRLAFDDPSPEVQVLVGDAEETLGQLPDSSFDFLVTSPPYWNILTKKAGLKAQTERLAKGLPTQYSADPRDLGNISDYGEFISRLGDVFAACGRVLAPKRYMAVIVSDFRHGQRFYLYHADLAAEIERRGPRLKGLTILAQDNKNLYPFAIPYAFVSNIHHQTILIFQKPG